MSNHVTEWLSAYSDGELKGRQLYHVEEHLAECEACRAILEELQGLSALLHEVPAPKFTADDRFVAKVNLLLPKRPVSSTRRNILEIGWWMIPVGLIAVWIFFSTAILISDMVSAASNFGLLDNTTALLVPDASDQSYWTSTLGQFGLLQGDSLQWAETTESISRNVLPQYIWQVSIAILYLTWIAIWWARKTHQGQMPLLEG